MKLGTIQEVDALAVELSRKCRKAIARFKNDLKDGWKKDQGPNAEVGYTKEASSLRRRSLDLTRKLADLRAGR